MNNLAKEVVNAWDNRKSVVLKGTAKEVNSVLKEAVRIQKEKSYQVNTNLK